MFLAELATQWDWRIFVSNVQYKTRYVDCKNKKEHEDKYNYIFYVVKTLYSMDGAH